MEKAGESVIEPTLFRPPSNEVLTAANAPDDEAANPLSCYRQRVRRVIADFLPAADEPPAHLHAAMRHAALGRGKHLRPLLTYATGEALGIEADELDAFAAAVELIHAFSLIHDDLPAMDDDDLRRGEPTLHVVYGEATAILAGDALQISAFQMLGSDHRLSLRPRVQAQGIRILAEAAGSLGMTGGQAMDIAAEGLRLNVRDLETMYQKKTGQLFRASVTMPCLYARRTGQLAVRHLLRFSECLGLAFQIRDDLLEYMSTESAAGKRMDSDLTNGKATYPSLFGVERACARAAELYDQAIYHLDMLDRDAELLRQLAAFVVRRKG